MVSSLACTLKQCIGTQATTSSPQPQQLVAHLVAFFFWLCSCTAPPPPPVKMISVRSVKAVRLTPRKPVGTSHARIYLACPRHRQHSHFRGMNLQRSLPAQIARGFGRFCGHPCANVPRAPLQALYQAVCTALMQADPKCAVQLGTHIFEQKKGSQNPRKIFQCNLHLCTTVGHNIAYRYYMCLALLYAKDRK